MKRMRIAAVAAVTVATLTACGSEPQSSGLNLPEYQGSSDRSAARALSPDELLSAAKAAIAEAPSVRLAGWTTGTNETLVADLAFSGPDGSGSYSFLGGTLQILIVDGRAWWKGDTDVYAAFGVKTASVTRKIDDRWIIAGSSHPKLATIQTPTSRDELLEDFIDPGAGVTTVPERTIDGVRAIGLTNDTGTLYVDSDTKRPVRLTLAGDRGAGIAFSYDDVIKPTPPPSDRILDLADLR